jgi:sn-glycerol 3-phosphate transport system substrate-binding protein
MVFLSVVLLAAACTRQGGSGPVEKTAVPSGPVTISFWHSMTDEAGRAFNEYVKEFNEGPGAEKQITVEAVFQGQYSDATAKLRPLLQTGQSAALPDVMQIDATGVVDYINTDFSFTVDEAFRQDQGYNVSQLMEAPLKAWNYGGVQLGLPVSASTTVMFYNKSLLGEAGITVPPTTFGEIITVAGKLPAANVNGQKLTAFAQMPNSPLLANWIGQIPGKGAGASYIVDHNNGRDGNATKLVCDTEGTLLTFLNGWKSMYSAGALLNVSDGLNNLFLTQQTVFLTTSTSNLASFISQIAGRFELGCTYFPRVSAAANYGATVSGSGLFMFDKGSTDKTAAAWEFVKFMTSSGVQARFAAATGYMPVNTGSFNEPVYAAYVKENPQAEIGARQLAETSADMISITVGPSRDFYYEIVNQVSEMLTRNKTPGETVESLSSALNRLLDDYAEANP